MADNHPVDLGIDGLQQAQEIGVGGFATVYRAYQPAFRRTVAVKVLATPNLDQASRNRFERECQAMGTLADHPHIVTIYGSGYTRQGRPYLVMAYLAGGSLQDRLDARGTIPWDEATLYAVHLAGALETAHRAGIVHRDIKPGNVLLSSYGEAQLTDFGIARISGGHETRSGLITASMAHAPPEVLDGHRPTIAADVYALGSTTFELMHGRPAFASPDDESMVPMLRRILTEAPPDLRARGVPDGVCRAVERAMAKASDQRPASAADLGRELQAARRAMGLDPGRITVPSDASGGRSVSFVSVPAPSPSAPSPGRPGAAPAAPPVPAGPARPEPRPRPAAAAPQRPAPPDQSHRRPPSRPRIAGTRPRDSRPSFALPPPPPPAMPLRRGRAPALVLGLLAGLVLLLAVVLVVWWWSDDVPGTSPSPTTTRVIGVSPAPPSRGYDEVARGEFMVGCVNDASNSREFCTCLFDSISEGISFERYEQLNAEIDQDRDIRDTEVWPMAQECWTEHPAAPR